MPIAIPGNAKKRSASRRNGDYHQPGIAIIISPEC
jgi:hypothetical protein